MICMFIFGNALFMPYLGKHFKLRERPTLRAKPKLDSTLLHVSILSILSQMEIIQ